MRSFFFNFYKILVKLTALFGADSGFDGIGEAQGARRGAVGLVNKPQKNSRKRRTIRFSSLITCI
ncbi:unknown [[Mannheimia] succiniciproducens MBEL55E]|uniref:Uncharacterized protein n=1 Tax=Mannheimia succiniciproducens (strain KCTC 0769BP / MBEL55E) TaxID=221988 RepID=Q65TG4_MANSM|nr:unknown [[Mannheimia] succiniciproducens MBEL55E]